MVRTTKDASRLGAESGPGAAAAYSSAQAPCLRRVGPSNIAAAPLRGAHPSCAHPLRTRRAGHCLLQGSERPPWPLQLLDAIEPRALREAYQPYCSSVRMGSSSFEQAEGRRPARTTGPRVNGALGPVPEFRSSRKRARLSTRHISDLRRPAGIHRLGGARLGGALRRRNGTSCTKYHFASCAPLVTEMVLRARNNISGRKRTTSASPRGSPTRKDVTSHETGMFTVTPGIQGHALGVRRFLSTGSGASSWLAFSLIRNN